MLTTDDITKEYLSAWIGGLVNICFTLVMRFDLRAPLFEFPRPRSGTRTRSRPFKSPRWICTNLASPRSCSRIKQISNSRSLLTSRNWPGRCILEQRILRTMVILEDVHVATIIESTTRGGHALIPTHAGEDNRGVVQNRCREDSHWSCSSAN